MDWGNCLKDGVATLGCVVPLFHNIITALLGFAGAVALIFIMLSGIRMILHGREAKQIEEDKKTFLFAIVGLLVILLSFFIVNLISKVTGVSCIQSFGFSC